jgi:hypothetical protein
MTTTTALSVHADLPFATQRGTVDEIVAQAMTWIADQLLLSQSRCVDVFLDLHNATDDPLVCWSIIDRLREIRLLNAVDGDEMRADLAAIAAIASDPDLSDPRWYEPESQVF